MLTEEQKEVVKNALTYSGTINVNAFAGTGKTTTCLHAISSALSAKWSVLYLVYNKSMSENAYSRLSALSPNFRRAIIKTAHAFAYSYVKEKIKSPLSNLRATDIATALSCDVSFAMRVLKLYSSYLHSKEPWSPSGIKAHVLRHVKSPYYNNFNPSELSDAVFDLILKVEQGLLPTCHDHYLKYFVEHVASKLSDYFDLVILDESQDANPVFTELIKKLNARANLLVGDRHQKIYGFRNTVDISLAFPDAKVLYLTESFRFGDQIADLANVVLAFKGEVKQLKGRGSSSSSKIAYLSRTNSGVLKTILDLNRPVKTERDILEILRPVLSVLYLLDRKKFYSLGFNESQIDRSIERSFPSVQDFLSYVEHPDCEDKELLSAYQLIKTYDLNTLPKVFNLIDRNSDVVCTTIHSSKGVEYDRVYLGTDIRLTSEEALGYLLAKESLPLPDKTFCEAHFLKHSALESAFNHKDQIEEEINLIYVAITRAMKECVGTGVLNVFKKARELFDLIPKGSAKKRALRRN